MTEIEIEIENNTFTNNVKCTPFDMNIPLEFRINRDKLVLHEIVGSGGYSVVVRGEQRGSDIVIKIISKQGANQLNSFVRECETLKKLKNQNIALLIGMQIDTYSDFQSKFLIAKQGDPLQCIMSEFCEGGNLQDLLHVSKMHLSILQKIKIITGIVKAMLYIHSNDPPILHRDLKSLNILLSERVENSSSQVAVKVTDFGISREIDLKANMHTSCVGSWHWMAPEVINNKHYDMKADVWSFGVILHEILFREIPQAGLDGSELCILIYEGKYKINRTDLTDEQDKQLQLIMKQCLEQDVKKRLDFIQIHNFLNDFCKTNNIRL